MADYTKAFDKLDEKQAIHVSRVGKTGGAGSAEIVVGYDSPKDDVAKTHYNLEGSEDMKELFSQKDADKIRQKCEDLIEKKEKQDDGTGIGFFQYMKRSFDSTYPGTWLYITSLFWSLVLVLLIRPRVDQLTTLFVLLMSVLVFTIRNNMTGSNLGGSLPAVTTPNPPHLGLAGVNLQNRYPYQYIK